ncbi:hypothetical protein BDW75DRAFT_246126 [Aspergillus navahoensis]
MAKRFHEKRHFTTVEEFAQSDMAHVAATSGGVSILSLADLDHPYLETLTADKFEAVKACAACAGTLVWVACGAQEDSPYSAMMTGIARTTKTETPRLNIQMFDLDPAVQNGIYANTHLTASYFHKRTSGQKAIQPVGVNHDALNYVLYHHWCKSRPRQLIIAQYALAASLIATQILNFTQEGGTLLVNEPDRHLQTALQSKAQLKNVNAVFTTCNLSQEGSSSIFLRPSFPRHVIQSIIPRSTAVFVNFSRGSSDTVRDVTLPCLPAGCLRIDGGALLSNQVNGTVAPEFISQVRQQLQQAYGDIESTPSVTIFPDSTS